jgi:dTDP-glucose pyrophosphorylase
MINILIPLAGKDTFNTDATNAFPKILSDVGGQLLIERAAKSFLTLDYDKKIVVAIPKKESEEYQLNRVLPLLGENIKLCNINGNTQGAACSALLAVENLDLDAPLIISSFEQVLDFDLKLYIDDFLENDVDAGVLTFEAIHPKWSYVKVCNEGWVTEAAEKMPISKNAIAGFYFYKSAKQFVEAAQGMIRKDVKTNGLFFIAPTINEIILNEGRVKAIKIDKKNYYHINDVHSLALFEENIVAGQHTHSQKLLKLTTDYVKAFDSKDIGRVQQFFAGDFKLTDSAASIQGCNEAANYIEEIFNSTQSLQFEAKNILVTAESQSIIEFELTVDGKFLIGTDVIQWDNDCKMLSMNAYLYEKK